VVGLREEEGGGVVEEEEEEVVGLEERVEEGVRSEVARSD